MSNDTQNSSGGVRKVSPFFGWFSYVFLLTIWLCSFTLWMYFGKHGTDFYHKQTAHFWFYIPTLFAAHINAGGFVGLLWLVVLVSLYWVVISFAFAGLSYGLVRAYFLWVSQAEEVEQHSTDRPILNDPNTSFLGIQSNEIKAVLVPMEGGPEFQNVYPAGSLCLARAALKPSREPREPLEFFELALMSVLVAHKHWTSDPDGHHADVGLLDHSVAVSKRMVEMVPTDRLARTLGLAHDLGKILAYGQKTREDGSKYWYKKTAIQDRLSALVVRTLPEFKQLEEDDRNTVNVVLTYTHSPSKLPRKNTTPRARTLLEKLREADGLISSQDREAAMTNAGREGVLQEIVRVLPDAIAALNINQSLHPDADADGWTLLAIDYVAVQSDCLREGLRGLVSDQTAMSISLTAENLRTPIHPATLAVGEALERMNVLLTEFNGVRPDSALFSIKSGKMQFQRIFLLKRDRLGQLLGEERLDRWGDCKYTLSVKGPSSFVV